MWPLIAHDDLSADAYWGRGGSLTSDHFGAYKRHERTQERWASKRTGSPVQRVLRIGGMYAYWEITDDLTSKQAREFAMTHPPHRVCVITEAYRDWHKVELALPEGQSIRFMHEDAPRRDVPRET